MTPSQCRVYHLGLPCGFRIFSEQVAQGQYELFKDLLDIQRQAGLREKISCILCKMCYSMSSVQLTEVVVYTAEEKKQEFRR